MIKIRHVGIRESNLTLKNFIPNMILVGHCITFGIEISNYAEFMYVNSENNDS